MTGVMSNCFKHLLLGYCLAVLVFPWQLAWADAQLAGGQAHTAPSSPRDDLVGFGSFSSSEEEAEKEAENDAFSSETLDVSAQSSSSSSGEANSGTTGELHQSSSSSSTSSTLSSSSSSSFSSSSSGASSSSSSSFSTSTSSSGNGSGSEDSGSGGDLGFLNGLLGGALGSILGQLTGGGGLGGLGGSFPNGDVQGTPHGLYGNLTDYSKLFPGDPDRSAEGEECEDGTNANGAPGDLSGNDTQVMSWQGSAREFNSNVGQAVANKLGSSAPAKTYGPGGNGGSQDFYNDIAQAAGDTSGKKYVVVFNCHGSPGSPGNWEGGLNTQRVEQAMDSAGNDDLSHITFVDGACFPCRGPYLASQQQAKGKTPINHVRSGQFQNRVQYYNPRTGNSYTVSGFVGAVENYLSGSGSNRILSSASSLKQEQAFARYHRGDTIVLTRDLLIGVARFAEAQLKEYQEFEETRVREQKIIEELQKRARFK